MTDNIQVFTQSSIRIECGSGIVYVDSFQIAEETHDADYILVTHDHFDHFSPEDIAKVSKDSTVLVVPENMEEKAQEAAGLVGRICTVAPGNSYTIDGLEFETVASYNNTKEFHPKSAGWVGYIVIADGKRIFIAGDTDANEDNKKVSCDIAMVPIGGYYTMDAAEAAGLINEIHPAVAIPTHYANVVGTKEDAEVFRRNVDESIQVEIKIP